MAAPRTSIVLGLQFGDEGKGLTTSSLVVPKERTLVVRFNGGHQAGHTVVKNGYRHVFSSFGSATLHGTPATFWSRYCTFYPKAYCNEREVLRNIGIEPNFYIDPLAMVTTPFDIIANHREEENNKHGSVGVGFGTTVKRHEETPYRIYAGDLMYEELVIHKLNQIADYYSIEERELPIKDFLEKTKTP